MYAIGVVAHTGRRPQAETLTRTLEADYLSVDDGTLGCDLNHRHVQHHLSRLDATWSVIVEDDAIPVPGLREQLDRALVMAPTPVVSLYLGRRYPTMYQNRIARAVTEATNTGAHWILSTHMFHAVGYAIRTELLPSLLAHPETRKTPDERITHWAKQHGHVVAYTWPSLVDHQDGPTTTRHRERRHTAPGRRAWAVGRHDAWNTTTVPMRHA